MAMTAVSEPKPLTRFLVLIMALACGMAVANLYYNQPLLAQMAHEFHTNADKIGIISMSTQIGYAIGMFLFVPLGDMVERRRMIVLLLFAVAVCLIGVATAQSLLWMYFASLAVGITTVAPQVIVPLAAQMANPEERGKVIGTVMSGLLIGVLAARTVSGFVGHTVGWRGMYWIAAGMMLGLAVLLSLTLPRSHPTSKMLYRQLMRSLASLVASQRTLREAAFMGAMFFGGFSVFWTSLAFFLEGSPYHFGSQVVGLFGLVGVVGASAAPIAGRLADRFPARFMVGVAGAITLSSFVCFWLFGYHLWGIVLGVILLDMGVQGAQILNQTRIYSLIPEARSRLNTVYMVTSFLGGAIGSWLGSYAWSADQWLGVCLAGGLMASVGLATWGVGRLKDRRVM